MKSCLNLFYQLIRWFEIWIFYWQSVYLTKFLSHWPVKLKVFWHAGFNHRIIDDRIEKYNAYALTKNALADERWTQRGGGLWVPSGWYNSQSV